MTKNELIAEYLDYMHQNLTSFDAMPNRPDSAILFGEEEFSVSPDGLQVTLDGVGPIDLSQPLAFSYIGWVGVRQVPDEDSVELVFGDDKSPYSTERDNRLPKDGKLIFAVPRALLEDLAVSANDAD